jgi:hypothetical protein
MRRAGRTWRVDVQLDVLCVIQRFQRQQARHYLRRHLQQQRIIELTDRAEAFRGSQEHASQGPGRGAHLVIYPGAYKEDSVPQQVPHHVCALL